MKKVLAVAAVSGAYFLGRKGILQERRAWNKVFFKMVDKDKRS